MVMLEANPLIKHLKAGDAYAASLEINKTLPPQPPSWRKSALGKKAAADKGRIVTAVFSLSIMKD